MFILSLKPYTTDILIVQEQWKQLVLLLLVMTLETKITYSIFQKVGKGNNPLPMIEIPNNSEEDVFALFTVHQKCTTFHLLIRSSHFSKISRKWRHLPYGYNNVFWNVITIISIYLWYTTKILQINTQHLRNLRIKVSIKTWNNVPCHT